MNSKLDQRIAVYPGTFDPVHLGHIDVIRRGSEIFEGLIVAVGVNPDKAPAFSADERVALLREVVKPFANVEVQAFDGLVVRFVRQAGARIMLRGLRTLSDMEYEFSMSLTNQAMDSEIETVFLMASEMYSLISSTLIRQIATLHGEISNFVPPEVERAILDRVREHSQK